MIQEYTRLTDEEYETIQAIREYGLNNNREVRRQINNRGLDLGIDFL